MNPSLAIKVCGMRHPGNIKEVEALGIDMMGFIFYPPSPRFVASMPEYLPERCTRTGVFVNADIDYILQKVDDYGLRAVQLHGSESPQFCSALHSMLAARAIIIKAFPITTAADFQATLPYHGYAQLFLFDTRCQGHGGSGAQFDWSLLSAYTGPTPFLLSGGIGPDSAQAIAQIRHPHLAGIDLNSRFESAPAIKDAAALDLFIKKINKK